MTHKRRLGHNWKLQGYDRMEDIPAAVHLTGYEGDSWLDAAVPGDVHSTLLVNGRIEDPYVSTNDQACRWIERKIWVYRTEFDRPENSGDADIFLSFEGLDTLAEVFVNGEAVAISENMFVPVSVKLTGKLKGRGNVVVVRFDPVVEYALTKDVSRFWSKVNYERIWLRKCACNFSWDWSPRLVTVGVWKDVWLQVVRKARIDHLFFKTLSIGSDEAEVEVDVEVSRHGSELPLFAEVNLEGFDQLIRCEAEVHEGKATVRLKVEKPQLWWTFDQGTPALYNLTVRLMEGGTGKQLDAAADQVGIRTIAVSQRSEAGTPRFTFVLNGKPIYAKGANWIPAHNFLGAISDERYADLITLSREANMNMLRVWGGGIYEKEAFYRECSRQGLLVWQDFMFSCSELPDYDAAFMANVRTEIIANVKALRNHPCIAIWAGNNENQAIHSEKMYYRSDYRFYGEKIFHELIPGLLKELDATRLYWPSSPWGGNDPNSFSEGDTHNWAVWAGDVYPRRYGEASKTDVSSYGISYRRYAEDTSKFSSEFGIHGSTVKETLRRYIPESELYYGSFELDYRNKDYEPEKGDITMAGYSGLPSDLDQYIDYSMLCQAEGLKFGVEHFRRRKPENSGSLIWQLNDCWPGISWSVIDYYLNPKGAYHYVARAFAPLLYTFRQEEDGSVTLWSVNDRTEPASGDLRVRRMRLDGTVISEEEHRVQVPANSSQQLLRLAPATDPATEFLVVQVKRGHHAPDNVHFFAEWKHLKMPKAAVQAVFTPKGQEGSCWECELRSDKVAHFVHLVFPQDAVQVSDNYLLLLPGEPRTIEFTCPEPCDPRQVQVWGFNVSKVECEVRG